MRPRPKRRFQSRDGERFFAAGRDNVDYELTQQQMRRAGDWRLGLRRDVLRELLGLLRTVAEPQEGDAPVAQDRAKFSTIRRAFDADDSYGIGQ